MDPVTLIYYGTVCAALSAGIGRVPGLVLRLGIGAAVGLVAAAALPAVRAWLGA